MSFTGLTTKPLHSLTDNALEGCREVTKSRMRSLSLTLAHMLFLSLPRLRRNRILNNFPSLYLYMFKDKETWVSYSMERQNTATHLPMWVCTCECEREGAAMGLLLLLLLLPPPLPLYTTGHYFLEYFRSLEYDLQVDKTISKTSTMKQWRR